MASLRDARKNWHSMDAAARAAHMERVMRLAVKDSRTLSVERRDPLHVFGKASAPPRGNGKREVARRIRQMGGMDYLEEMRDRGERAAGWDASA